MRRTSGTHLIAREIDSRRAYMNDMYKLQPDGPFDLGLHSDQMARCQPAA
ncbi:hypothetical protein MAHJHV57_49460 [Mycobacterium avium subsp. hominissuis]